jgi:hypothetical protein
MALGTRFQLDSNGICIENEKETYSQLDYTHLPLQ